MAGSSSASPAGLMDGGQEGRQCHAVSSIGLPDFVIFGSIGTLFQLRGRGRHEEGTLAVLHCSLMQSLLPGSGAGPHAWCSMQDATLLRAAFHDLCDWSRCFYREQGGFPNFNC